MRELYPGDQGTFVRYLQLALRRAGQQVAIDGIFGPKTCAAVEQVTGSSGHCAVGDAQWNLLLPYLKGYVTHTVAAGDSLYKIAQMHETTEAAIREANPGINAANLMVGSILVVPLSFPLVATNVPYSSQLMEWIVESVYFGNEGQSVELFGEVELLCDVNHLVDQRGCELGVAVQAMVHALLGICNQEVVGRPKLLIDLATAGAVIDCLVEISEFEVDVSDIDQ